MQAVASDIVVYSSSSVKDINVERTEMFELKIQKMDMLSEIIEESRLPGLQPERKQKTRKERITESCDDWEKSKEEFCKAFVISQAFAKNVCSKCFVV